MISPQKNLSRLELVTKTLSAALLWLVIPTLSYISGFRPFGVGADHQNYVAFYERIDNDISFEEFRFEPLFVAVAYCAKTFGGFDYSLFACLLTAACLGMKAFALSDMRHPMLALLFYVLLWFPVHENTQLRIAVAISTLFLALYFKRRERITYALVCYGLAFGFHYSSVLGVAMIEACSYLSRFSTGTGMGLLALGWGVFASCFTRFMPFLLQLRSGLEDDSALSGPPNVFNVMNILTMLFLVCFYFFGLADNARHKMIFLVCLSSFFAYLCFFSIPVLANRSRELLAVFLTFIAFEYDMRSLNVGLACLSFLIAIGAFGLSLNYGLFSD